MAKKKQVEQKETLAVMVLDESGSMAVVREKTISGVNEYIQNLAGKGENIRFTLVKFGGTRMEKIIDGVPIGEVKELTSEQYIPNGGTPLYDAIGKTAEQLELQANKVPVIFLIMTDGQENASTDYTREKIAEMIKRKESDKWVFTYVGANQDAFKVAKDMNIDASNAANYAAANPQEAFVMMASASATYSHTGGTQKRGLINKK